MTYETLMLNSAILTGIILLSIWTMIWKGIALWKAGRNNQLAWFLAMFIFNTAGILPIIYLAGFQKKKKKRK